VSPSPPRRIVVLVGPDYEELEVWYPKLRLEEAGYEVKLAGLGESEYRGKHGYPCPVDGAASQFDAAELAGIVAPGGWAPDKLRRDEHVLRLVRGVHARGALVATICHGPWILISAGIVRGRRLTSTRGIRDDLTNAGAIWVDRASVTDGNIVSSRVPSDLPAFGAAMLEALARASRGPALAHAPLPSPRIVRARRAGRPGPR
jgi:protease I